MPNNRVKSMIYISNFKYFKYGYTRTTALPQINPSQKAH